MSYRFRRSRGRFFPTRYDTKRMDKDMQAYQEQFGVEVEWWFYAANLSTENPIYAERDIDGGARYVGPRRLPVMSAVRRMGDERAGEEGFFTLDTLEVRMSYEQARRAGLVPEPSRDLENEHTKDRIVYEHKVFDVISIISTGQYDPTHRYLVVFITANRLRPDELVFDPDFVQYSAP
jgi:hypothetical protein